MEISTIVSLISSVGFPIVACVVMGMYVKSQTESHASQIDKMQDRYDAEIKEITTALNNNTVALTKLCERLEIND